MLPPFEQHRLANEFEPRCELQRRVIERLPQPVGGDIFDVHDLVLVDVQIDISLDEKDVVN
jgi:hypothetical protein